MLRPPRCAALGDACYADDGSTLAESVIRLAFQRYHLATAESCTGGLVGSGTDVVFGSSRYFMGGLITYANGQAPHPRRLPDTLAQYGAVSARVAEDMALGVRERFEVDVAVLVTGVAGPAGGIRTSPWDRVVRDRHATGGTTTQRRIHPGDREGVRERATITALAPSGSTLEAVTSCASLSVRLARPGARPERRMRSDPRG